MSSASPICCVCLWLLLTDILFSVADRSSECCRPIDLRLFGIGMARCSYICSLVFELDSSHSEAVAVAEAVLAFSSSMVRQ